jgi:hypothetical protein
LEDWRCGSDVEPLGRMLPLSKANRQKGIKREKRQFVCWCHEVPFKGPVRFKHEEARKDWNEHNLTLHNHLPALGFPEEFVHYDEEGPFVGGQEIVVLR